MKPSDLLKTLTIGIPKRRQYLIKGKPGIGKTDIIKEAARQADADIIISHPVVADPTDYKGMPVFAEGVAQFVPFNDLKTLIDAKRLTVFFLDDFGQATPSVQAAAMQLILLGQINGHKISDKVVIMAATNRRQDRAGVNGVLEPVKSRFHSIIELTTDIKDFIQWGIDHDINTQTMMFCQCRPDFIDRFDPTTDLVNSPCPRTIVHAAEIIDDGFPPGIRYELLEGAVGKDMAVELSAFLQIADRMNVTPDQIIADPHTAPAPKHMDVSWALTGALARFVEPQTMGNVMQYMTKNLGVEFQALFVEMARKYNPDILATEAYLKWFEKNQNILN